MVAKEVKLIALRHGIRIPQYVDDWLVRARSHQTCLQHTQTLVAICQDLGWLVNMEKSELDPKQVFNLGYHFDLKGGKVRPTLERWQLSSLGQTQTEWSLLPEVFQSICNRWHQPHIHLFAARFNKKLAQFVSPVPNPLAWANSALSLPLEDLDPYAFPSAAILGKVVVKLQDYPCKRIISIAPGWPNMPWFWDLVTS